MVYPNIWILVSRLRNHSYTALSGQKDGHKKIIILSLLLILGACSSDACKELVLDSFKHQDTSVISGKEYYLYSRTTGFQEKVVFFELYEEKLIFDKCMEANINPIYARPFDESEDRPYIKELTLQPDQPEKLKITYTKNINEGVANVYDVKFSK